MRTITDIFTNKKSKSSQVFLGYPTKLPDQAFEFPFKCLDVPRKARDFKKVQPSLLDYESNELHTERLCKLSSDLIQMAFEVLNAPPGSQPELAPILKSPSFNITLYLSASMLYTLLKRNLEINKYQQLIFDGTLARLNKRKLRPCFRLPRDDKRTTYHYQYPKYKKKICYIDSYKCLQDNLKHHLQNRELRSNTSLNTAITRSSRESSEYCCNQLALGIFPDLINHILNFFILNDHHSLLIFALALQAFSLLALLCATLYHKWSYPQATTPTNLAKESPRPANSRRKSF